MLWNMKNVSSKSIMVFMISLLVSCGNQNANDSKLLDQFSGSAFFYYDVQDRKTMVENAFNAIQANYAPLDIKKVRLGLDIEAMKLEALLAEQKFEAISDSEPLRQAASNLSFLDRVQTTIAKFQDTHFTFRPVNPRPTLYMGIELVEVNGHLYIVASSDNVMRYNNDRFGTDAFTKIAFGDEVVEIDGVAPGQVVDHLVSFQRASSKDFARMRAVSAITERNYAYPSRSTQTWKIRNASGGEHTVEIPWYVSASERRLDAEHHLASLGFGPESQLEHVKKRLSELDGVEPDTVSIAIETGYWSQDAIKGTSDVKIWRDVDDNSRVVTTSIAEEGGRKIGVLQVFSYSSPNLKNPDSGDKVAFAHPIREFVKKLKADKIPLIIDLRDNGGGDPELAFELTSIIARSGASYAATTQAYKVTRRNRQMVESWNNGTAFDPANFNSDAIAVHYVQKAIQSRTSHTVPFVDRKPIEADSEVGGYDEPIVALIAPGCISSCDVQAMLLKSSGRATLIGSHANGTGAGSSSTNVFKKEVWKDEFQVISLSIPNLLFGLPGPSSDTFAFEDAGALMAMNSENRPVVADVQYVANLNDYLDQSSGWLKEATKIISSSTKKKTEE